MLPVNPSVSNSGSRGGSGEEDPRSGLYRDPSADRKQTNMLIRARGGGYSVRESHAHTHTLTHTHSHAHTHTSAMYMCARMCVRGVLNIYLPTATNMIGTERFQRCLHSHFESVNGDPCGIAILLKISPIALNMLANKY